MNNSILRALVAAVIVLPFMQMRESFAQSNQQQQILGAASLPYPHIGNYYAYDRSALAPIFTRYNLVIVPDDFTWTNPSAITALRSANPTATILTYDDPAIIYYTDLNRFGTNAIYPGWFALKAGSTLTSAITSTQTTITVANASNFALYNDVLVDNESMHITAMSGNTLTVVRGWYSTAAAHAAGARIAPHASIPLGGSALDNHDLADQVPWLFNESTDCPIDPVHHQTWLQFFEQWVKTNVLSAKESNGVTPLWDGIFYDDTNDILYYPADLNNAGVNDLNGVVNGVNVWGAGLAQLFSQTRADFPAAVLLGNGPDFSNFGTANGQELYEPNAWSDMSLYGGMMASYHNHMANAVSPQLTFVHPNTPSGPPNLQLMRFGLTSALLDNGTFVYDQGATQEGTPWWFDEYDDGAGSALTAAINTTTTSIPVVNASLFHVGDDVVVEDEMLQVVAITNNTLSVVRGTNSTLPASHDAGQIVATMAQVQAGLGYLGQPLGAAYTLGVSTTNEMPNGSFEAGQSPWGFYYKTAQAATFSLDTSTAADGTTSAKIMVPQAGQYDSDVGLYNKNLSLASGKQYTATFYAKSTTAHKVHLTIYESSTPVADATVAVGASWAPYSIPFTASATTATAQAFFAMADAPATTWLDGVSVVLTPNPTQRRDFTGGTVLVNASTSPQTVDLSQGGPYCHLRGDQNPSLNNGSQVTSVSIQPQDGIILTHCGSTATASPAPTASVSAPSTTPSRSPTPTAPVPPATSTRTATPTAPSPSATPSRTATSIALPPSATPSRTATPSALVPNGSYESGQSPWVLYTKTTPAATLTLDTSTAAVGTTSAKITVPVAGNYDSDDGFYNPLPILANGKQYTISFYAKSSTPHKVHLMLEYGSTTKTYFGDFKASVGTAWAQYSFPFTAPTGASQETLLFALADVASTTWLDGVSIQ